MINLLPDGTKKQLRAARANVVIGYYLLILLCAAGFLALLLFGSMFLLDQTKQSAQALIQANDSQASAYSSTQEKLNELRSDLELSKTILDNEVLYSRLLPKIGQLMPEGTIIDSLRIQESSYQQPVEITIYAKSTDAVTSLRDRFQSSSLFSGVTIESVSSSGGISGYPVSASLTLTFNREAAK